MLISVSLVVLLGAVIALLLRVQYLRWTDVLLCSAFGFLLAATGLAPVIISALDAIGRGIGALGG